jgi:molecular chaperone GrpE
MRPIDDVEKFDPHLHHAVDRAPAESDEHDQTILEVYQRGYHFKERLLRPAMVKVAVKD